MKLRGPIERPDYKRYVLPLIFLRFLSLRYEHPRAELEALVENPKSDWYADDPEMREEILEEFRWDSGFRRQFAETDSERRYRQNGVDPRLTHLRASADGYRSQELLRSDLDAGLELRADLVLEREQFDDRQSEASRTPDTGRTERDAGDRPLGRCR